MTLDPRTIREGSGDAAAGGHGSIPRQILTSLIIVTVCWIFLRLGSLIVSVAVSHTWHPDDPIPAAYAFVFRQLIMVFLYPSVLNVFRPAFIPLYNEIRAKSGREEAQRFAGGILEIGVVFATAAFVVLWSFPEVTVRFMAPHFEQAQRDACVRMLREMAPGIFALLLAEMYLILFHAEKKFGFPHTAEAIQKIGWGLGIVALAHGLGWQDRAIGVSYSAACFVQLAVNMYGMIRVYGWVFVPVGAGDWFRRYGARAGALALPLVIGTFGARLRDWLTHRLQSSLDNVSYVSVEFARQLTNLPVIFLGTLVSIVMLPHLAHILHTAGSEKHRETVQNTVETLCLLSIPIVAGILVLAPELMALVFIRPGWGPAEYSFCADGALAMRMIAVGFLFVVIENILMPGLFSIQSMWWPVMWGLAASGFQILCLAALAEAGLPRTSRMLLAGVAFVYPLSRIFKNSVLLLVLRRKIGIFPGRSLVTFPAKLAGVFAAVFIGTFLAHRLTTRLLGGIPVGAPLLRYKLMIALQIALPSVALLIVFAAAVLLLGYRQRLEALWEAVRKRPGKDAADAVES